ncbi:rhophilin-2-B isoform X3 [Lepeophtheirus salmonis]|uniref:rhophilin-2-B isoform X3 n=1 Tax=Lepeophtheirus salmonis TaxID=72036 RepID=UPI001AE7C026|nr:rhophilin-2-B-like isoform X1 [Lepeophtheirus salmonis]
MPASSITSNEDLILYQIEKTLRKGSDPRAATCRGKLQSKRSKLNMEINKELMLRSGAENLFKATTNKKMKETVALELSFVNSNLQLLKEQLAELNSSVELYQNSDGRQEIPMIPLGLKETKEIDFREPFKDFILEHYSEEAGVDYENAIAEFMDIRQAMRTPARDTNGIALLFEHLNQLYFVERRFFPPDRSLGIFFEWYDSLTGVPSSQRTVAFEKASVLFNIGALYTQIGTRQNRGKTSGLDAAVDNFLRSAGTFQYIHENFTNAPSMDLSPDTLEMLVHLMCAQARECLFEKSELSFYDKEKDDIDVCLVLGQEASHVSEVFKKVSKIMSQPPVKDYVPYTWVSLSQVKKEYYSALAHYYVAIGLLDHKDDKLSKKTWETLQFLHEEEDKDNKNKSPIIEVRVPTNNQEKRLLGKAHLREALLLHEESFRMNRMCRELRKKDGLQEILRLTHDRSLNKYASIDDEDDFQEVLDPPSISPSTQYQLSLNFPDLSQHKVQDLFADLGPVAIFNAKHHWSAPRSIKLRKKDTEGFGFSVKGDSPVVIAGVDINSLAEMGGMKESDYIVGINDQDVKWAPHDEVVTLIKSSGNVLKLKLVTPMDKNYTKEKVFHSKHNSLHHHPGGSLMTRGSISPSSTSGHSTGSGGESSSPASSITSGSTRSAGSGTTGSNKKAWNLFKRSNNNHNHNNTNLKKTFGSTTLLEDNIILR